MYAPGSMTIHADTTGPWVGIVFLDSDEFDACEEYAAGDNGTIAEYMSRWDYGTETDDAHTEAGASWGTADRVWTEEIDGVPYVVSVNYALGYASLNRRPVGYWD